MSDDNDLRAALAAARAAIDHAVEQLSDSHPSVAAAPRAQAVVESDWRPLKAAARECHVHAETMARRARAHGLGRLINRVWHIDMVRVRAWQEGRPYARLVPEDSPSSGNMSDAPDGSSAAS